MNEKVKQLAKQAYEDVISNTPSMLVTREMFEQKFAELIVLECADWLSKREFAHPDALKQHFGVY